jgi:hypothetical protein
MITCEDLVHDAFPRMERLYTFWTDFLPPFPGPSRLCFWLSVELVTSNTATATPPIRFMIPSEQSDQIIWEVFWTSDGDTLALAVGEGKAQKLKQVLGRTDRLLSFHTTRIAYKTSPRTITRCRGNVFTDRCAATIKGTHRHTHGLSFDTTRTA